MDRVVNQRRRFRDLGVVELTQTGSMERRRELVARVMGGVEEIKHGSGQIIIAGGITDRQKRHLLGHLGRFHSGLRARVHIDREFRYHNGTELVKGAVMEVADKVKKPTG